MQAGTSNKSGKSGKSNKKYTSGRRSTRIWSRRHAVVNPGHSSPASNNRRKKVPNNHTNKMNHYIYNPELLVDKLKKELKECKDKLNQKNLGGVTENAEVNAEVIHGIDSNKHNRSAPIGGAKHRRLTKRRRHTNVIRRRNK